MRLRHFLFMLLSLGLCLGPLTSSLPGRASQPAALPVYADALDELWQNWSWGSTLDFAHGGTVQSGSAAIEVTYNDGWVALFLNSTTNLDSSTIESLRFAMHGGATGGQQLLVRTVDQSGNWGPENLFTVPANQWQNVEVSLSQLGLPASISGLVFQNGTAGPQPTFYLDNIELVTEVLLADVTLTVDLNGPRHPISPDIYGINFADQTFSEQERTVLGLPVNRWGGNGVSRYNYQDDVSSAASDWYFVNTTDDDPASNGADNFITTNQRAGTDTLMTIPMLGWVAKNSSAPNCGFPTSIYGAQQSTINWWNPSGQSVECGNGNDTAGNPITPNASNASSYNQQVDEAFVSGWITQLVGTHGNAANGGVKYYSLDNEPMLWSHTHRDLHPNPASYDEVRDLSVRYGAAVKQADPTALVTGPALWGWSAYEYSALDLTNNFADRQAHGNIPFAEWYLQQMQAHEQTTGVRILDYLDLHYYPQNYVGADSHSIALRSDAGDAAEQAMRLRAVRSLWDPTYTDETWINTNIQLIPRAKGWVANNYPGTRLALTEYNFGGYGEINGALVQADVLGIFGQEALDMAVMWKGGDQVADQPWEYAFQLFRNYDGSGSRFGDESIRATSADRDLLSIYAAERSSDGALTIIVINKSGRTLSSNIAINGITEGSAEAWGYNHNGNLTGITRLPDQSVNSSGFTSSFPPETITLFVVDASDGSGPTATNTPLPQPTATDTPTPLPQPTATDTPTTLPTAINTVAATDTPTALPTATNTVVATATDTPTSLPTALPTATNTPTPTATALPAPTSTPSQPAGVFLDTFDSEPSQPTSWRPDGWDVAVHARDPQTLYQLDPMKAAHGSSCEPPPATHWVSDYEDAVYQCKNHMMTAIQDESYGVIYLAPNQMADFSQGEAVIRFDISTERTSSRDWWDIWVTPYEYNLQLPLEVWLPDLQGPPKQAVHIRLDQDNKVYGELFDNHNDTRLFPQIYETYDQIPGFEPSARNRSTFELRISETHLKFGMPDYDHWWIDTDISALGWDSGVVQLGHHSYNPTKCDGPPCALPQKPNTWHWDNVSIAPSQPFTIIGANRRYITEETGATIAFDAAAPANAHARFSAFGENLEVSFDGGNTWEIAQMPPQPLDAMDHATSYFTPIPAGITTMMIRGDKWYSNEWFAKDFAIWSTDQTTSLVNSNPSTAAPEPTEIRLSDPNPAPKPKHHLYLPFSSSNN